MKVIFFLLGLVLAYVPNAHGQAAAKRILLFDGKTFRGWQGDTVHTWRIEQGALVGGSLTQNVPHNEFISTTRNYTNFVLKLKFKLSGEVGFINGGVQFHSQRISDPPYEMTGYQADLGKGYWALLKSNACSNPMIGMITRSGVKAGESASCSMANKRLIIPKPIPPSRSQAALLFKFMAEARPKFFTRTSSWKNCRQKTKENKAALF
jgi:hypothetical protein